MACRVRVIVMRHLPTAGNIKRHYIGWTDEPIIEMDVSPPKTSWHPTVVYGSDLLRAKQSATYYFPDAYYTSDPRFRESHFGDWEGKTYDLLKQYEAYRNWIDDPYKYAPPNGERLDEVEKRVRTGFSDLPVDQNDLVLMTHGGPIRLLLTRFSPEVQGFWSWTIPHGSAWQFEWETMHDFKEGKRCVSLSAVPLTAKGLT